MSVKQQGLTPLELKAGSSIALIYGIRMLGLFMILPVFSIFAENLDNTTPLLIGLALGIYGLTQGLLQIPFGMLSDKIGRKPVIAAGLIIFAIGSVVAAYADTIYGVIAGRAIQGAGAIAAALMALAADLSREEHRLKIMSMIGINIGVAFAVAMGAGLWIAALNVKYRDFRYIVPFIVQFGLYISPVGFSSSVVPEQWRLLYSLNPMVGVIDGFRWAILGVDIAFYVPGFILSLTIVAILFAGGLRYFRKTERTFADII